MVNKFKLLNIKGSRLVIIIHYILCFQITVSNSHKGYNCITKEVYTIF